MKKSILKSNIKRKASQLKERVKTIDKKKTLAAISIVSLITLIKKLDTRRKRKLLEKIKK